MDAAVFHNSVAAGRDQRPTGFERSREVGQRRPYPRFARRQVISIFFHLQSAPHRIVLAALVELSTCYRRRVQIYRASRRKPLWCCTLLHSTIFRDGL